MRICAAAGWLRRQDGKDVKKMLDKRKAAIAEQVRRKLEREPEQRVYVRTAMEAMPGSCTECEFGRKYGCVGDVECRILREYFTGNVEPQYKERPDECPLVELEMEEIAHE